MVEGKWNRTKEGERTEVWKKRKKENRKREKENRKLRKDGGWVGGREAGLEQ